MLAWSEVWWPRRLQVLAEATHQADVIKADGAVGCLADPIVRVCVRGELAATLSAPPVLGGRDEGTRSMADRKYNASPPRPGGCHPTLRRARQLTVGSSTLVEPTRVNSTA